MSDAIVLKQRLAADAVRVHHLEPIDDAIDAVQGLEQALRSLLQVEARHFAFKAQDALFDVALHVA